MKHPRTAGPGGGTDLGPTLEFLRLLWAVDHALQSASKRMARRLSVTGPQRLVIRLAGKRPGISAGDLADILLLHPSTLTGILKRLSDRGLIEMKADPGDRRRVRIQLTDSGRKLNSRAKGTVEAAVGRTLARVPARDVQAVDRVLSRLSRTLSEEMGLDSSLQRR